MGIGEVAWLDHAVRDIIDLTIRQKYSRGGDEDDAVDEGLSNPLRKDWSCFCSKSENRVSVIAARSIRRLALCSQWAKKCKVVLYIPVEWSSDIA